jgi:hypothetical protein
LYNNLNMELDDNFSDSEDDFADDELHVVDILKSKTVLVNTLRIALVDLVIGCREFLQCNVLGEMVRWPTHLGEGR